MSNIVPLNEVPLAPPSWRQLAVLVNDGSLSMTWDFQEPDDSLEGVLPVRTKAAAVEGAIKDLLNRMKSGHKAANFSFAFVNFNERVTEERAPRDLIDISTTDSFDPTAQGTGGTLIHTGLEAAGRIVEDFLAQPSDLPLSAVVVVMSDGEAADPEETLAMGERIKALPNTQIAACLFATKGKPAKGAQLLQALASEPRLYQTIYDAEQLRAFFHASVTSTAVALVGEVVSDEAL